MRGRRGSLAAVNPPRLLLVLAASLLLTSCAGRTAPTPAPEPAARPTATAPFKPGATTDALPLAPAPQPTVHLGTPAAVRGSAGTAPPVQVTPGGDVTLNFTDADIHEVVRAVVGDILGLNYSIDSKVQGTVTVRTMRPLPRAAVLPTLGRVLRANGASLIEDNGMVRVTPLEGATAKGAAPQGGGALQTEPGAGVRVVPLHYMGAAQLQKLLLPFVPTCAVVQSESIHNILVMSGTREDMDALADLVRSFDVDWLQRMSFAIVPLRAGTAETIISEMQAIIAGASGGAEGAADALRLVPVERLNAVLVITAQPRYLDWARQQIATLDAGGADGVERTYIYHVQYGRASDLADVLTRVFGGGAAGGAAATPRTSSSATSYLQTGAFGGGSNPMASSPAIGGSPTAGGGLGVTAPLSGALGQAPAAAAPTASTAPGATAPAASASPAALGEQPSSQGQAPIRIVTDERNNAFVVATTARQYRRIEEALRRLDVKPLQVVIEATIAEVTLNDELQFGLQWFFRNHSGTSAATFTNVTTAVPTQVFPGFSYMLSEANVNVVLNALSSITNVNVVSSPQLLVLNNDTAQLQVGQQVPVPVQQQQSVVTPEAPLVNTISYLNTGVILSVTPRANATGEVTLDIEQEVSDVATSNTAGLNAPTINERRVKSTVSVESGESVALGGLISNTVSKNRSAVPLLGDIPVLGALFRNDDNTTTRTELLVLISPRIIRDTGEARAATDDLERRMHEIRPIAQ